MTPPADDRITLDIAGAKVSGPPEVVDRIRRALEAQAAAETLEHLRALASHPSAYIMRPAASLLMMLDHAPPEAACRRILREIENHPGPLSYQMTTAGKRYRAAIAQVSREWQTVCEHLAEAVHGKVLLDSRRETLLSNETRPDIIVDDGAIKRDDHGTICFCELAIDATTGSVPKGDQYAGWCRRLEYWYNGQYWNKPWKVLRTQVAVLSGRDLCELAIKYDRQDLALEIARLMGPEGNYTYRWVHSFLPEPDAKPSPHA